MQLFDSTATASMSFMASMPTAAWMALATHMLEDITLTNWTPTDEVFWSWHVSR